MVADLAHQLHEELLSLYERTGRATGYWPNYFLRAVRRRGGLDVARTLLRKHEGSGFTRLIEAHRVDLSVEAIALSDRFASLFSADELAEARRRLQALPPDAWPQRRDNSFPEEAVPTGPQSEGSVQRVLVNHYERSRKARDACVRHHGTRCVICDVDFGERYGEIGRGFIHVHHLRPLAGAGAKTTVDPKKDLVPVCPNCHAMLHQKDPPIDLEELRRTFRSRNG